MEINYKKKKRKKNRRDGGGANSEVNVVEKNGERGV